MENETLRQENKNKFGELDKSNKKLNDEIIKLKVINYV